MTATVGVDLAELMTRFARNKARTERLEADGTLWCWACSNAPALMPSLHCSPCLAASYRRSGTVAPLCVNRRQTPEDAEAAGG
jgi:hypothetical protein